MKLEITEILSFYELPQIVVARNVFGTQFLMLLESDETEQGLQYLSVPVSNEKLNLFKGKKIDLLSIYTKPEVDQYYLMYTKGDNEFLIKQINSDDITEDMLPLAGFYCEYNENPVENLVNKSIISGRISSSLAIVDAHNSHQISCNTLATIILNYQDLVKSSHASLYGTKNIEEARLDVIATQAASFDVEFQSSLPLDLFGSSKINETFGVVDKLLGISDDEQLFKEVEEQHYKVLGSLKKFVSVLAENKYSLRHSWVVSTIERSTVEKSFDSNHVCELFEKLKQIDETESDDISFEGVLISADAKNGKWGLLQDNGKIVRGHSDNIDLLNGIQIKSTKYTFKCHTRIIKDLVKRKETKIYTLYGIG